MKFIDDFKNFALKGNVIDMAVGVVVGGAFTAIITSLVNNIIMPLISFGTAGLDFTDMKIVLRPAEVVDGVETAETAIGYGHLIQSIVYFLLVALVLFLILKLIFKLQKKIDSSAALLKNKTAPGKRAAEKAAAEKTAAELAAAEQKAAAELAQAETAAKAAAIESREANMEVLLSEIRDLIKKQTEN